MSETKRLLKEGVLFTIGLALVLIAVFAFPTYIFIKSGEYYHFPEVMAKQAEDSRVLFGPAYSDHDQVYKMYGTVNNYSSILVLGGSRAAELRKEFFNESFYNAGIGGAKLSQIRQFLLNVPQDKLPKTIILELAPEALNPNYISAGVTNSQPENLKSLRENALQIYADWIGRKFALQDLKSIGIGLNAKVNQNGFRYDGSYSYSSVMRYGGVNNISHYDYHFREYLTQIKKGTGRMAYSDDVSGPAVDDIRAILNYTSNRGISVIGFFGPYAPTVWQEIEKNKKNYGYLFKLNQTIGKVFDEYGYSLFDFFDPSVLNLSDCEFVDSIHGSEEAYAKITEAMGFMHIGKLQQMLVNSSCLWLAIP